MKERILLSVLLNFCVACSTYKYINANDLIGSFYGISKGIIQGSNTQYFLELKENNLFKLTIRGHDYRPECSGFLEYKKDILVLRCYNTESLADKLSNGYMNQREFIVKLLSKNKLKLDNMVLKRK